MKAAVLSSSPGRLQIEDVVLDEVREYEVRVGVRATGLCRSDLHHMERGLGIAVPVVLGHEAAGVVVETGTGVSYVQPGDHVVAFAVGFCGMCEWCISGRPNLCRQSSTRRSMNDKSRISLRTGDGCAQFCGLGTFAEEILVHENNLVKISDSVPFREAALVGCAVPTGVGAVTRTARVKFGSTVAIVGCGGVGLNCIQGSKASGARQIIAIDVSDEKLELARQFGATDIVNSTSGDAIDKVHNITEDGVDYSFEALGLKNTCELAYHLLRPRGVATLIGLGEGTFELPIGDVDEKTVQTSFMGSVNFREDIPALLDMGDQGLLEFGSLVSDTISLDQINEGYDRMRGGAVGRTIIEFC